MQKKEIIITAPEIYGEKLKPILSKYNFKVIQFPTIETVLYKNPKFKVFFKQIKTFDYIILPSRNAINSFIYHAERNSVTKEILDKLNYTTIGKDAEYLSSFGLKSNLKPEEASTTGIFKALKRIKHLKKIAVISPKVSKIKEPDIIPDFIKMLQTISSVLRIDGYITKPVQNPDRKVINRIKEENYDLIAFTSGGEIEALKYLLEDNNIFSKLKVACFGPFTASVSVKTGLKPEITGKDFNSFEDFAITIKSYFKIS